MLFNVALGWKIHQIAGEISNYVISHWIKKLTIGIEILIIIDGNAYSRRISASLITIIETVRENVSGSLHTTKIMHIYLYLTAFQHCVSRILPKWIDWRLEWMNHSRKMQKRAYHTYIGSAAYFWRHATQRRIANLHAFVKRSSPAKWKI